MNNKKILFYSSIENQRFLALSDILMIPQSCYFKGKELGYDNISIQWFEKNAFSWNNDGSYLGNISIPKNSILPIKFINDFQEDYDLKIDISKPDSLYNGCPSLISKDINPTRICCSYLNKYYKDTGEKPVFNIPKTGKFGDFILLHYRHSNKEEQLVRNLDISYYISLIKKIKELYPNIKIWKIGERSPFDNMFDKKLPYFYNNFEELLDIINECKIFICSETGTLKVGHMFNIPIITLLSSKSTLQGTTIDGWNYFKTIHSWIIGDTDKDYSCTDKQLLLTENKYEDFNLLKSFMEKNI